MATALPSSARRYVAVVALAAVVVAVLLVLDGGGNPPGTASWLALPFLVVLQMVATYLRVTFRARDKRREGDGVDLGEAVLAPLLFAFPVPAVLLAVATAHLGLGLWRRAAPTKTAFNVAQFVLAAGCAHLVLIALAGGREGVSAVTVGALLAALVAAAVVNNVLFLGALVTASGRRAGEVLTALRPVVLPGWVGGFALNAVMGLLFVLAYEQTPLATALFVVPLVVLHSAYRGYAIAQTDRVRLAGLHAAAQSLLTPLDPFEAIDRYLADVADCFDAGSAHLVLRTDAGREIYAYDAATRTVTVTGEEVDAATLHGALAAQPAALRLRASSHDPAAALLAAAGHDNCLAAPLREEGRLAGAVIVFDQVGFDAEGGSAEVAVLEALARETVSAFTRGRLVGRVLAEQRKLAEVVDATSDGIFSIATDGRIRSWNPAMEWLTGMPAETAVGSATALAMLRLRTPHGRPVDVTGWSTRAEGGGAVPPELVLDALDGTERRLQCSTSASRDDAGELRSLVVIARDVTAAAETERLRQDVSRLAEQQAAQRVVVDHLQQAVMPSRPEVSGADLAVVYEASEPTAPTGGDLYDWQVLSNGELHLVVLDVLGHGVSATRDALAVMHTLRVVAVDGTPLEEIITRADALLAAQHPDLVATVVVARFDPKTGALAVAAGGHPPALIVDARGGVEQLAPGGGAIGWPGAGSDGVAHARLEPGDSLVLYTDGLVEARKNILEGLDDLVRHAAELAGRPAQDMADELLARSLAGAERRDDSLALVLRRQPVPALDNHGTWRIRPEAGEVSELRRRLQRWLADRAVDDDDIALVAVELLSNAARHSRGEVVLAVAIAEDRVVLDVSDDGAGSAELASAGLLRAADDAEGGRGLFLVRALSEAVEVLSTDEGSVIRAAVARSARRAPSTLL